MGNPHASPVRQVSVVPTKELAQATHRQKILCNVMSAVAMAITRVITQIGHKGGLTIERPRTVAGKLDRESPANHPRVIVQRE